MNQSFTWQPGMKLDELEKLAILAAFRFYRANKSQTAISLGITVRTLENKLGQYEQESREHEQKLNDERERNREILNRMRGIPQVADVPRNPHLQRTSENVQAIEQPSLRPNAGIHLEPTYKSAPQQPMPVPQRQEVQSVLPKQPAQSGQQRRR